MSEWVMVPREPTVEMEDAAYDADECLVSPWAVYRAMIAAAPTPEREPSEPVAWWMPSFSVPVVGRGPKRPFRYPESEPLYAHPAPTALPEQAREAMERAANTLDLAAEWLDDLSRSPGLAEECRKKRDVLRAQLAQIGGGQ